MEQEILENQPAPVSPPVNLETMNERIEQIYISVEKTRKYFLWTLIITIITIVLPLIALIIIIPIVFRTYSAALGM